MTEMYMVICLSYYFPGYNYLTRVKLLLTCIYIYHTGIYAYIFHICAICMYKAHICHIHVYAHICHMQPICQMYVSIWQIAFLYVTYVYLQACLHVGCIPDTPVMCIQIGSLSTLFVFTPCPVKLDYIDNNQVITYKHFLYVTCVYVHIVIMYICLYTTYLCAHVSHMSYIYICTITCICKLRNPALFPDH